MDVKKLGQHSLAVKYLINNKVMKTYKDLMNDNRCPINMKYDKKLKQCVPKK